MCSADHFSSLWLNALQVKCGPGMDLLLYVSAASGASVDASFRFYQTGEAGDGNLLRQFTGSSFWRQFSGGGM